MSAQRVLQALRRLESPLLRRSSLPLITQVRWKGAGRFKMATDSGKQKDKWVPRLERLKTAARGQASGSAASRSSTGVFDNRVPEDDVWFRAHYSPPLRRLADALNMHREYAAPDIAHRPAAIVQARLKLDMAARKKNKFMSDFSETILLPHFFDDGTTNQVLAFCKEDADKKIAEDMGAAFVGGVDLVKAIEKGEIHHDDYSHVICTLDMLLEISKVRKHMVKLFPNKRNGTLDDDMEAMMRRYTLGKNVFSVKDSDSHSDMVVPIGNLSMSNQKLLDNFYHYVDSLETMKGGAKRFVDGAVLYCKPSNEKFHIDHQDLVASKSRTPVAPTAPAATTTTTIPPTPVVNQTTPIESQPQM